MRPVRSRRAGPVDGGGAGGGARWFRPGRRAPRSRSTRPVPLPRCARSPLRHGLAASRPGPAGRAGHRRRLRAAPRPAAAEGTRGHHRRRRGRAGLHHVIEPRLLPRAVRAAPRYAPAAPGRQSWHRRLGGRRLPGPAVVRGRLLPQRAGVQPSARRRQRRLGHRVRRRGHGGRPRSPRHRPRRHVRRLLRQLLHAGLRRAPPRTGPHHRARRHVPGRRPRPVVPGHDPRHRRLAPHRLRAGSGLRGARRRPRRAPAPPGRRAGRGAADRACPHG